MRTVLFLCGSLAVFSLAIFVGANQSQVTLYYGSACVAVVSILIVMWAVYPIWCKGPLA